MVARSKKRDKISWGFLLGMIVPIFVFIIVYLASQPDISIIDYVRGMLKLQALTPIVSLCVLFNLISFMIFNKLKYVMAMRGVMLATILYVIVFFIIKQVY